MIKHRSSTNVGAATRPNETELKSVQTNSRLNVLLIIRDSTVSQYEKVSVSL